MSEYADGTVAMVTYQGERQIAMKAREDYYGAGRWWGPGGHYKPDSLDDIQPLVCLPLTREDADVLAHMGPYAGNAVAGAPIVARICNAIREQLPEPESPKRWTVATYASPGCGFTSYLHDNGVQCGAIYNCDAERAQTIADALNAAEATS